MKQWFASIIFIFLFITASAHTVNSDNTRLHTQSNQTALADDAAERFSHFAMPSAGISGIANHQQAQQRTAAGDDFTASFHTIFLSTTHCIASKQIDMFGNTLLVHNYPAHNFW